MHFDELDAGDFKIYTGALEAPSPGYRASVVISRVRGVTPPREVYREENLAGGYVWPCAHEALLYAMTVGQKLLKERLAAA